MTTVLEDDPSPSTSPREWARYDSAAGSVTSVSILPKGIWAINPEESRMLRRWDIATSCCLLFVCFVSPYEVAFQRQNHADFLFCVNRCVDVIFSADIVLQFFIMFPVRTSFGVMYIGELRLIARRYLRTWFAIDVVSILPFDILGVCVQSDALSRLSVLRAVRLVRLLKLVQLVRGMRIVKRYELEVGFSYRRMTLLKLFVVVVVAAHWYACFLGILSTLQGDFCYGKNVPDGCVETWLTSEATTMVNDGVTMEPWRVYTIALHEAATLIVHPHSSKPTGDFERIFFIIMMFLGGFIWTRVISQSTAVTTSMNRHSNAYHSLMDDLNASCHELKLPHVVRRRLRAYFMKSTKESQHAAWRQIVDRMSPMLQAEIVYHTNKSWLHRVPYLRRSPKLFASRLTMCLHASSYAAREVFGDVFTLYILSNGVCSRATGRISVMTRGDVWGEEHLLLTAYWLLQPNTTFALTYTQVLALKRDEFEVILEDFPEVRSTMRRFVVHYVVMRGIVYESKRRKDNTTHTKELDHHSASCLDDCFASEGKFSHESRSAFEFRENILQRRRSQKELKRILKKSGMSDHSINFRNIADPTAHFRKGVKIAVPTAALRRCNTNLSQVEAAFASHAEHSLVDNEGIAEESSSPRVASRKRPYTPTKEPHMKPLTPRRKPQPITPSATTDDGNTTELRKMEDRIMEVLRLHHDEVRSNHAATVKKLEHLQQRVGVLEGVVLQHRVDGSPQVRFSQIISEA